MQKTFGDKKVHIAEETILLRDGSVNQMIVYSAPLLNLTGNVSAVIKLLTNVNMIKDVHKELVTLGQSFAVLTHDLKNMLEGLEGGAYVVDEGIKATFGGGEIGAIFKPPDAPAFLKTKRHLGAGTIPFKAKWRACMFDGFAEADQELRFAVNLIAKFAGKADPVEDDGDTSDSCKSGVAKF